MFRKSGYMIYCICSACHCDKRAKKCRKFNLRSSVTKKECIWLLGAWHAPGPSLCSSSAHCLAAFAPTCLSPHSCHCYDACPSALSCSSANGILAAFLKRWRCRVVKSTEWWAEEGQRKKAKERCFRRLSFNPLKPLKSHFELVPGDRVEYDELLLEHPQLEWQHCIQRIGCFMAATSKEVHGLTRTRYLFTKESYMLESFCTQL